MRGSTRRRPAESMNPQPTPDHHHRQFPRDSDASFSSSRPSSIGVDRALELPTDRAHQGAAVRAVNAYLSSHSSHLSLKTHQISSAKDITETLHFVLHQLDYPSTKLEDDLFLLLKSLNCPFKVNKSTLRAPNTPHNWPSYLAVIHWLVQIAMYKEHLVANSRSFVESNNMFMYALDSYLNYIRGEDDAVDALDREFVEKLEREKDGVLESVRELERSYSELEGKAEALRSGQTERERLEKERSVLEEDVKKFNAMIGEFNQRIEAMEKVLEEKGKELEAKVEEKKRIDMENEEDAERMKRELQAVERDISEAEAARNLWEEKIWDLHSAIGHKFKELESLAMECNHTARRLKLGDGFHYSLNAKGSTPAQVMGIDYKSTLKPGLQSFTEDIKRTSMAKLEELILLQQQASELNAKVEAKKNQTASIQSYVEEVEDQMNSLRIETEEYTHRLSNIHNKHVSYISVKDSELKLQEAIKQGEEEIQMQAQELFKLVDSVSKYKEHVESKIVEIKSRLESGCSLYRCSQKFPDKTIWY
ncbi:hypothetical protein K2173_015464 [Erythroxylum novogranatense]|uniref:Kinetochore protein NDC80 n=1 Tax=Erythroxylum novogranatense TaxID=1862640 RepID=A0AAV8SRS1_9ROSI|nr:hypothetical protein K2173_015464 [Erythroxylum novogranatense]